MPTERLPLLSMNNLVSVLQDKLCSVRKELKESTAATAEEAVRVAQPIVASAEPADQAAGRYVVPFQGCTPPPLPR